MQFIQGADFLTAVHNISLLMEKAPWNSMGDDLFRIFIHYFHSFFPLSLSYIYLL
jgi:hypothetical protein